MDQRLQLSKALNTHRRWKDRLLKAIETGTSEFKPATVRMDSQCEFGKWLYNDASAELQQTAQYQQIKQLHSTFHHEAARILEIALQGRRDEAHHLLGVGSNFEKTAEALNTELMGWHLGNLHEQADGKTTTMDRTRAILEARAKALTKSTEVQTGESIQLVVFQLANEKYGIATEYVQEVQPMRDLTPVPCTPGFVVGVINIRGSIYSVIDIRSFFGVEKKEYTETTKVILVNAAGLEIGILADDVKGATNILVSEIKPPLATQGAVKEEFLQGVTKDMLIILNLETLLRDERIIVHEEA